MASIPFGPERWDGTRSEVEIREYWGEKVLSRGVDPGNPWRNPGPHASLIVQDAGPWKLRDAAAALIAAAEIIEGATGREHKPSASPTAAQMAEPARTILGALPAYNPGTGPVG